MKVLRLLFVTSIVFILSNNFLFAQKSVFQDAKELAKLIREQQRPRVAFNSMSDVINFKIEVDGKNIQIKSKNTRTQQDKSYDFLIEKFGNYKFSLSKNSEKIYKDSIVQLAKIIIGKSIIDFSVSPSFDNLTIDFTPLHTEIFLTQKATDSTEQKTEMLISVESNFLDILEILDFNSDFKPNSRAALGYRFNPQDFEEVPKKYANNPFFPNQIQKQILLDPSLTQYLQNKFLVLNPKTSRKADWEKIMYGDSVLQFGKTVSFEDVSVDYRKPITSKNELDQANNQIDQSSRSLRFLDARTVAVGLSDFIAERAQEELNLTFFRKFKENLKDSSELTILFPNTASLLYKFKISDYKTLLSNARQAFTIDLDNLGLNFPKILELETYSDLYNSPEVYNLALIYSVADLSYREIPVEKILIEGYKKLEKRKVELSKSINNQLANSILHPTTLTKKQLRKKNKQPSIIKKGNELSQLQKYILEYIQEVDSCGHLIEDNSAGIDTILNNELKEKIIAFNSEKIKDKFSNSQIELKSLLTKHNNLNITQGSFFERYDIEKSMKREINKLEPESSRGFSIYTFDILDSYQNHISANLQKKEYFEDIFNDPSLQNYELHFKGQPKNNTEIVSAAFSKINNLLDENFENQFSETLEEIKENLNEARTIKGELLLLEKQNEGIGIKLKDFLTKTTLIANAIDEEIVFWEKITRKDYTYHEIAALYFLRSLVDTDDYLSLIREANWSIGEEFTNPDDRKVFNFIEKNYKNTLGLNFQRTLDIANSRLDSIQINFNDKIAQLKQANEFRKINPQIFSIKEDYNLNVDKIDSLKISIRKLNQSFLGERKKIENKILAKMESDTGILNLQEKLNDVINQQELIREKAETDNRQLNQEEKDSINFYQKEQTGINKQLDLKEKEYEKQRKDQTSLLQKSIDDKISVLDKQIIKLGNPYQSIPLTSSIDSLTTINKTYSLSNNYFLKKLKEEKIRQSKIDGSKFQEIDKEIEQLKITKEKLKSVQQKRKQVTQYLNALENEYCKDLARAKINAQNLSKGLELSTHVLLAFRDYKKETTTLEYKDTVTLTITKNEIDTSKGYILETYTQDTILLKDRLIEENTIDTTIANWISFSQFDSLRKDPLEWNLFLGLLHQRLSAIESGPKFSAQGTALIATKFFDIANKIEKDRTKLRIKKATRPDDVTFKDYYPFIKSTVDLFNTMLTTQSIGESTLQDRYVTLKNLPIISDQALSLYENIYVKEYGNAILNAMELLRIITEHQLTKKERNSSFRTRNAVLTYGSFMANMINAKTSDQVKNIMKSAALPPGSSRVKRQSTTNLSINSYLGLAAGRDKILNAPDGLDELEKGAWGASLSVPIGFTYSVNPYWWNHNSSISLHVPLLDLGAITAYRQNPKQANYNIDNLPDFSWNNLFAPGAFVVYNFPNNPFSLGLGGQYGPQLREIKFDTGEAVNVNSWRFPMAFFTIDVPLFNLHTGSRKIKID